MNHPPLIARISGIEGTALAAFSSPLCMRSLAELKCLTEDSAETRGRLVDKLYTVIDKLPPELRRFALAVKRDVFNNRNLEGHSSRREWSDLQPLLEGLGGRALEIERRMNLWHHEFAELHRAERNRERASLLGYLDRRDLIRGLSLASPELIENIDRLRNQPFDVYGRKEKKAERSFLRYLSRAAAKLSPYSTLTRNALGTIRPDHDLAGIRLLNGSWSAISLLRLRRYLVDQYCEVLMRHPSVRERLEVTLNDTLEELEPGQYRLLRPMQLQIDEETGTLRYSRASQVKVRLGGPLVDYLRQNLGPHPWIYRDLLARLNADLLAGDGGGGARLRETVEKLISIGFLQFLPPWPSHVVHLESSLLEFLAPLAADAELRPVAEDLERLVAAEKRFPEARPALSAIEEMNGLVQEIWSKVKPLAGSEVKLTFPKGRDTKYNYYDDVFLLASGNESEHGEVVHLARRSADRMLQVADSLWWLTNLFQSRQEFLHALSALIAQRWPTRKEVGFLEVFAEAQELWRSYISLKNDPQKPVFDPYGLRATAELQEIRAAIREELERYNIGQEPLPLEPLQEIVARIPEIYDPIIGSCLFVQPADPQGDQWVVNRLFEGTGRYGSRFAVAMPELMRKAYVEHLTRCSGIETPAGRIEILDILYCHENTVNIHWPQTPKVLESPGEKADLPPGRRLHVSDLRVHTGAGLPYLVDASGQRFLPCHLTPVNGIFMPVLLKFLAIFGPTTGSGHASMPWKLRAENGIEVGERLTIDRLVIRRRRWIVPASLVPELSGSESEAFRTFNEWRLSLGIPERVFLIEKILSDPLKKDLYKPQYIDFSSPMFMTIFQSALTESSPLTIEEALPDWPNFPPDATGCRWGVEILLDSLALGASRKPALERFVPEALTHG